MKLKQFGVNDKECLNFKRFPRYKSKLQAAYKKAAEVFNLLKISEKLEIITSAQVVASTLYVRSSKVVNLIANNQICKC